MIVVFTDLDLRGSGYMNIAIGLCTELAEKHGREVKILGIGYTGQEHNWPFSIIPIKAQKAWVHAAPVLNNLIALGQRELVEKVEAFVVLLDVPHQERIRQFPPIQQKAVPHIGVFPIESGPLCYSWATMLAGMDGRFVISKFGKECLDDRNIESTYLPIGIDPEAWRMPKPDERMVLRNNLAIEEGQFVIITVADNQERKNLSASARAVSKLVHKHGVDAKWILVTRVSSNVGWKIHDILSEYDILERTMLHERGIEHEKLWILHAVSDAFLLTSKAEGLCMPVVEAMATGTPVVATETAALVEHLYEGGESGRILKRPNMRGFPIEVEYWHQDPFGNSLRAYASADHAATQLKKVHKLTISGGIQPFIEKGRAYAESRTWEKAGDVLNEGLDDMIRRWNTMKRLQEKKQAMQQQTDPLTVRNIPPTIPQPVGPITIGEKDDEQA